MGRATMKIDNAAKPRSSLVSANSAKLGVDVTIVTNTTSTAPTAHHGHQPGRSRHSTQAS